VFIGAGAARPLRPLLRPLVRVGDSWATGVSSSKRVSFALLGDDAVVLPWRPRRVRWLSGVLRLLNLTGD
jgi:hypothetical protein